MKKLIVLLFIMVLVAVLSLSFPAMNVSNPMDESIALVGSSPPANPLYDYDNDTALMPAQSPPANLCSNVNCSNVNVVIAAPNAMANVANSQDNFIGLAQMSKQMASSVRFIDHTVMMT